MALARFFRRVAREQRRFMLPEGERIYAIGDIHGRLDLFEALLGQIDADDAARGRARTTLVLLGDLIDRGPDSCGVVERAMRLRDERPCVFLTGNHEEMLLRTWDGDRKMAGVFVRAGGRETILSYGVSVLDYDACDLGELTELVGRRIPRAHIEFLRGFDEWYERGDYLFVHAGIRPGVQLQHQSEVDLRWIRREFLEDERDHPHLVIHGHTITEAVDARANRIGIDTGAYASGTLTAIGLEGGERWFLST